jgi:hypothetical protein
MSGCINSSPEKYRFYADIYINYNGTGEYTILFPIPILQKNNLKISKMVSEIEKEYPVDSTQYGVLLNITSGEDKGIEKKGIASSDKVGDYMPFILSTTISGEVPLAVLSKVEEQCRIFFKSEDGNSTLVILFVYTIFPISNYSKGYSARNCEITPAVSYIYPQDFPLHPIGWTLLNYSFYHDQGPQTCYS